jgi:hypothetical protein
LKDFVKNSYWRPNLSPNGWQTVLARV